jgi:hypothetical protein
MPIFFSPEVIKDSFHILKIVNASEKTVGSLAVLFDDKKIYVYGILEEGGVSEDFREMIRHFLKGMAKAKEEKEIYTCLYTADRKISINGESVGG